MRFLVPLPASEQAILRRAENLLLRCCHRVAEQHAVMDPAMVGPLLKMRLAAHEREVFAVIYLDSRHRIIAMDDLHAGTIDGCEVHPRVVVQQALRHNAAALIIGHNHPSGSLEPSLADRALTSRIKAALDLVDIRLLDSFVVAATGYTSLAMRGWA